MLKQIFHGIILSIFLLPITMLGGTINNETPYVIEFEIREDKTEKQIVANTSIKPKNEFRFGIDENQYPIRIIFSTVTTIPYPATVIIGSLVLYHQSVFNSIVLMEINNNFYMSVLVQGFIRLGRDVKRVKQLTEN